MLKFKDPLVEGQNDAQRVEDVNFAISRFLKTASANDVDPAHEHLSLPADAAQASFRKEDLDEQIGWESARNSTSFREDKNSRIRAMLAEKNAASLKNEEGQTPFHLAALEDEYIAREALNRGLDVEVRNVDRETPLICAVKVEKTEFVKLLLQEHAEVNVVDDKNESCLHLFAKARTRSSSVAQLL